MVEAGIIDLTYVREQMEMARRKELLEKHPNKIWKGKDGLWRTYLPDKENKRKLIKRSTQEAVESVVIAYWRSELENPTVREVYDEWIEGKLKRGEIQKSTRDRYNRQFDESLSEFGERRIKTIKDYDIEDTILLCICEHQLTQKGYRNLRTLFYGIFKRAKKRKLVDFSITEVIADMEISHKSFRRSVKQDEEVVFSEKETTDIIDYIMKSKLDIINLGILLCFKTGVRPGELAGLKAEDVSEEGIKISRTEIFYKDDNGKTIYEVRDFPKTEAGIRRVVLPTSSKWIIKGIKKLNPFGEYLFERNGVRLKAYNFTARFKNICRKVGIAERSLNKIRKTYGTMLINGNVEESVITSLMGHTDINTTKTYYYKNRKSVQQIEEVLNNVSGL